MDWQHAAHSADNQPLILAAAKKEGYAKLIDAAVEYAKARGGSINEQTECAMDRLLVEFGSAILKIIPGRVSTEVDARLFFDKEMTKAEAHQLNKLYEDNGVSKERVLIKIASTWEGIQVAPRTRAWFHLDLSLVGRILDWYKARPENKDKKFVGEDHPGVQSVQKIFKYYKQHGYRTIVMGASFRNTGEIIALSGVDFLTISPNLLEELKSSTAPVPKRLKAEGASSVPMPKVSFIEDEPEFRWELLK
ncbi:sedoheptulose-7-phosphate:D-glyceraldehyde-3- phosphate transaldolase [Tulasnella sp. 417]|nr:sedoheptulose-7-phosphate:D-glyceraldehyde-3- phosphate transaldolase [Tulasnella sp. 417]